MARKAEFRRAFELFDMNHDGHISSSELAEVLAILNQPNSPADVKEMLDSVDADGSGTIEFEEFCVYMERKISKPTNDESTRKVFQAIDADNSGLITPDELREGFSRLGVTVSLEEARGLVRKCDKNNDGKVNYEEFVSLLKEKK